MSTILYPYGIPVTLADSKGGPTKTKNKGGNGNGIGPGGGNGVGKGKGQGGGSKPSGGGLNPMADVDAYFTTDAHPHPTGVSGGLWANWTTTIPNSIGDNYYDIIDCRFYDGSSPYPKWVDNVVNGMGMQVFDTVGMRPTMYRDNSLGGLGNYIDGETKTFIFVVDSVQLTYDSGFITHFTNYTSLVEHCLRRDTGDGNTISYHHYQNSGHTNVFDLTDTETAVITVKMKRIGNLESEIYVQKNQDTPVIFDGGSLGNARVPSVNLVGTSNDLFYNMGYFAFWDRGLTDQELAVVQSNFATTFGVTL